jgi:hypothetical protein
VVVVMRYIKLGRCSESSVLGSFTVEKRYSSERWRRSEARRSSPLSPRDDSQQQKGKKRFNKTRKSKTRRKRWVPKNLDS